MKKLLLSVTLVLASAGVVYAGCWTTYNFSPTTVQVSNKSRLVLQCFAMRSGGTGWTIASDGLSATHAGVTYSASTPFCSGSSCSLFVVQNGGTGSHFVNADYDSNGGSSASIHMFLPQQNENGNCQLYTSNNVNPSWNSLVGLSVKVRYCR